MRYPGGFGWPRVINFYRVSDEYGCFSNFSPHPIDLDGKRWPTAEHYFQAQKFENPEHQEARLNTSDAPKHPDI